MTPADVLKLIKEKEIKFADLRFTDTRGKEQHVTIPARLVDEDLFRDGKMFDGSSIAGWKGINESDMILMPEANTAVIDPFFEDATVNIRCDVIEPATMQGYERDPRSLAKRAEAYLKSTGIADNALFGPENEFFIFDSVRYGNDMRGCFYSIDSAQGAWNSGTEYTEGNRGHRPGSQRRLLPGAAGRCVPGHPLRDVSRLRGARPHGRSASSRGRHRRPERDRHRRRHAGAEGRPGAAPQVRGAQRGPPLRQDRDFHAEAAGRRQRQRHARSPVAAEGRQGALRGRQVRRPLGCCPLLHRRHHQARAGAQRLHQRRHQQLQASGAGIRGARDAGVLRAQPLGLDPHSVGVEPEGAPHRGTLPGFPARTPTSPSRP